MESPLSVLYIHSHGLTTKLQRVLRRLYPGENAEAMARVLAKASRRGWITYGEIDLDEAERLDLMLLLIEERLLIPKASVKSMAWEDRLARFKADEVYEMPHAIRNLIQIALEGGVWNPREAVRRYLNEIGEERAEVILTLLDRMVERVEGYRVDAETLRGLMEELGLGREINRVIAELKGGGILSPSLRDPRRLKYEVNPALMRCWPSSTEASKLRLKDA